MTAHQRAVLEALTDCHDGAATVAWLRDYTGLQLSTVQRCLWRLRLDRLVHQVGFTKPGRVGGAPAQVFAATITGRRLVEMVKEAA